MEFRPAPAQQILISTARAFLREHCPPELAQRLALDAHGFDETLWRRMAELGWPGLLIPLEVGGSGGSLLDVILLTEEMGRTALPGPFVPSAVVATSLVLAAGSAAQQKRLLPALAAGERVATLALVEESGSGELDDIGLACAVPGRLSGRKLFVRDAHVVNDLIAISEELIKALSRRRPCVVAIRRGPSRLTRPSDFKPAILLGSMACPRSFS